MKKRYSDLLVIVLFVFILGASINVYAVECSGVFSDTLLQDLDRYVYTPIKWLTPIALLLLTSLDFAGVVFAGKKENMTKAKNNFLKRSAAAIIIFFAPDIIKMITGFIQNQSMSDCLNSNFK